MEEAFARARLAYEALTPKERSRQCVLASGEYDKYKERQACQSECAGHLACTDLDFTRVAYLLRWERARTEVAEALRALVISADFTHYKDLFCSGNETVALRALMISADFT